MLWKVCRNMFYLRLERVSEKTVMVNEMSFFAVDVDAVIVRNNYNSYEAHVFAIKFIRYFLCVV